ncbi:MAG: hypothetical protein OEV44_09895 [Spirochaetota bacterium]|nr:hypothetical protein [Spirochaetota bacterium]
MNRSEIKRFDVRTESGNKVTIIAYSDIVDTSISKTKNEIHGVKYYETKDGNKVKEILQGVYQVVHTGEILRV